MGAGKQGRNIGARAVTCIDELTTHLSLLPVDAAFESGQVGRRLLDLELALGFLEAPAESRVLRGIVEQLGPVIHPDGNVPPPFGPDTRQRVTFAVSVLTAMRGRILLERPRSRPKLLRRFASECLEGCRLRWNEARIDIAGRDLGDLAIACEALYRFYWAAGVPVDEPRMRVASRLSGAVAEAVDADTDVRHHPQLLREMGDDARTVCRPSETEHWEWLKACLG